MTPLLLSSTHTLTLWNNPLMHLVTNPNTTTGPCRNTPDLPGGTRSDTVWTLEEAPSFATNICTECLDLTAATPLLRSSWEHIHNQANNLSAGFETHMSYRHKLDLATQQLATLGIPTSPKVQPVEECANWWMVTEMLNGSLWVARQSGFGLADVDEQVEVSVRFRPTARTMSWLYNDLPHAQPTTIPRGLLLAQSGITPWQPSGVMPLSMAVEVFNDKLMLSHCTSLRLQPQGPVGKAGQAMGLLTYSSGYTAGWKPDTGTAWNAARSIIS